MCEANVLVIGSGGREHALCWKLSDSPLVKQIYCAPGSVGIGSTNKMECVDINIKDHSIAEQNDFDYAFKSYYYPLSPSTIGDEAGQSSNANNKNPLKRKSKSIDVFFDKPKKMKKKIVSSSVGSAHPTMDGISYITSGKDDGATASHLVKIEVFDLKKLKNIDPSEQWKHADVRVKYYTESEEDKQLQSTHDVIYNITKNMAENNECRKFFIDNKK